MSTIYLDGGQLTFTVYAHGQGAQFDVEPANPKDRPRICTNLTIEAATLLYIALADWLDKEPAVHEASYVRGREAAKAAMRERLGL